MPKVTWLGDEDPSAQVIHQYGHTFVKGEPTNVDAKDAHLEKFKAMEGVFAVDTKADPVEAKEPEVPDVEAGTEKAALKAELRALGEEVKGNPNEDTLRARLAALHAKRED